MHNTVPARAELIRPEVVGVRLSTLIDVVIEVPRTANIRAVIAPVDLPCAVGCGNCEGSRRGSARSRGREDDARSALILCRSDNRSKVNARTPRQVCCWASIRQDANGLGVGPACASITARRDPALVSEEGIAPSYGRSRCVPGAFRGAEFSSVVTLSRAAGTEAVRSLETGEGVPEKAR